MNYLWSFLPGSGGSAPIHAQPGDSKQLDEEQLHELHAQWLKLQANHATEAEGLLARLVEENQELKVKLEDTARELRDVKAGRREDETELKRLRATLESLGRGKVSGVSGLFRRYPLQPSSGKREIDHNKPLWGQNPPLCLDHYLARCLDERCHFSHAYSIPRPVLDSLAYEVSRTPCPLLLSGEACLNPQSCFFAHRCPRARCDDRYCAFSAPGMHSAPPQVDSRPPAQRPPFPPVSSPLRKNSFPGTTHLQRTTSQRTIPSSPPLQAIRQHSLPLSPKRDHLADLTPLPARRPLSPSIAPGQKVKSSMEHLSDRELQALLEKTKREEEDYEKGMKEDPFYSTADGRTAPGRRGGGEVI